MDFTIKKTNYIQLNLILTRDKSHCHMTIGVILLLNYKPLKERQHIGRLFLVMHIEYMVAVK